MQVRGDEEAAASLGAQDEVEFEVVVNRRSGGHRAEAVELLCKAQDRRELGQVCPSLATCCFCLSEVSGKSTSLISLLTCKFMLQL